MKHLIVLLCASMSLGMVAGAERPNVVFILADDLGWSDTTLYGTTKLYQTPNVERLAARGMTFTRAYAASPLCSPTRASIFTGLSPARTGITAPVCHVKKVILKATPSKTAPPANKATLPNSATRLQTGHYTLAEALKDAGYVTGHFGKWHLGHEPYSPLEHGFDVDVPHWPGPGPAGSYVAPWKFPDFDPDTPSQHIEDRMTKEAVAFMKKNKDKPFFLNYWMFSVHAPFDARKKLIDKYRRLIDPKSAQRSPTYAAMVESMDDAVGTLLDTLDSLGIAKRTIIIFASDNGGNMYNQVDSTTPTSNAPLRGGKATMYEGGVRGPCVVVWPDVVQARSRSDEIIQSCDFYPTLLEMLKMKSRKGLSFDGVSIVPALQGKALKRDAIFTYFPHAPRVPDWLPPAVSVHKGDWKLIRIFHGGEKGQHRWKLFNLRQDIGEKNNLAEKEPKRVRELDALIEQFLKDTHAVRPLPNPQFNPSLYRLEDEGKARRKKSGKAQRPIPGKPVAGWRAVKDCRLELHDGTLRIQSTGNDPHFRFALPKPLPAGNYVLHLSLLSKARGGGQFFWQEQGVRPAFIRDRSRTFDITPNAKQKKTITFTTGKPMIALRLDPARGPGEVIIFNMKLTNPEGKTVEVWSFDQPKK